MQHARTSSRHNVAEQQHNTLITSQTLSITLIVLASQPQLRVFVPDAVAVVIKAAIYGFDLAAVSFYAILTRLKLRLYGPSLLYIYMI